jgi:hypothetical protein
MKFRYYIQDPYLGAIVGTDSEEVARNFAATEEHFVVDTETGKWLGFNGPSSDEEVEEAK